MLCSVLLGFETTSVYRRGRGYQIREMPPIGAGSRDIREDLGFQRLRVGEVALGTHEMLEQHLDIYRRGRFERTEQEGFDSEFVAVKGGPGTRVGNGLPAAPRRWIYRFGDIHAARNEAIGIRSKVERGDGLARADAVTGDDIARDGKWAAEQTVCPMNSSIGEVVTNGGARDDFSATCDGREEVRRETEFGREGAEGIGCSGLFLLRSGSFLRQTEHGRRSGSPEIR